MGIGNKIFQKTKSYIKGDDPEQAQYDSESLEADDALVPLLDNIFIKLEEHLDDNLTCTDEHRSSNGENNAKLCHCKISFFILFTDLEIFKL